MANYKEIIVVGGGVIGLTCAWRLGQAGVKVLLVERDKCGGGATGASLGALMPTTATRRGPIQALQRRSLWGYETFASELEQASGIEVGFDRCGKFEVCHDDQRRRMAISEAKVAVTDWPEFGDGPVMEILDRDTAQQMEPGVQVDEHGAIVCRATARVDVEALVNALKVACQRAGVEIREEANVTGLQVQGDNVRGVKVGDESGEEVLDSPAVLIATGAWTTGLSPEVGRWTAIRPVRGQAILLNGEGSVFSRMIKRRRIYLLRKMDGGVTLGSTTEPEAEFNCRVTAEGVAELTSGAVALMPSLANADVVRMWAGLRPEGIDRKPTIGAISDVGGLFVAAGHFKTGIGLAPITAEAIVDLITKDSTDVDVSVFNPRLAG